MPRSAEEFLLKLLQACAACAPEPLYPSRFAREHQLDRRQLDGGLDELRRLGLVKFTDWVKDAGQGYALTDAGLSALKGTPLAPPPTAQPSARSMEQPVTEFQRGEIARATFLEPASPDVTRALLIANVLFFAFGAIFAWNHQLSVAEYIAGNPPAIDKVLVRLGAINRDCVFLPEHVDPGYGPRPQYERIILSAFLHVGLMHLIMNMYFLYTLGPIIESMWGSARFLAIYLSAGVISGCVVLLFQMDQPRSPLTAGASGCLFGIFVAMLVWYYENRGYLPERFMRAQSRNLLTNSLLLLFINFLPGISWQAHFGGAIGGALAAWLVHLSRFNQSGLIRVLALAALPLVPVGFFLATLWRAHHAGIY